MCVYVLSMCLCIPTTRTALLEVGFTKHSWPSPAKHPGSFADMRDEPYQLFHSVHQELCSPSTTSHWFLLWWKGHTRGYPQLRVQCWCWNTALSTAVESKFVSVPEGNWVTGQQWNTTESVSLGQTSKLQPHHVHVPSAQHSVSRTRSVDVRTKCSSGPELTIWKWPRYLLTSASPRSVFPPQSKGKRCTSCFGPFGDPFSRINPRSPGGEDYL